MPTTTQSVRLAEQDRPKGAASVRQRTSDLLRRIDEELEHHRRNTASSVVWDSLFAGWDEPANQLYADLWVDWEVADRNLFDDIDEVEERAAVTLATLMSLETEFVGPQTPPDLHTRPAEHEWGFELVGDIRAVDDSPVNLEAAAHQIAVVGDIGLLERIPLFCWDRSFQVRVVYRVNQLIRELSLERLPAGWWR